MRINFCSKCGNILIPERTEDGKFLVKCERCFFSESVESRSLVKKEKFLNKRKTPGKIPNFLNEFATYKNKCSKCGYDKAQIIDMGIFYSDEDNLILLKCGKCGWSERIGEIS